MDYGTVVQQSRLLQAGSLGLSALCLYSEADRVGLTGFLIPFSFICAHFYLVLVRWNAHIDGRYDFDGMFNAHNVESKIHYGVQVFSPFLLGILVHFTAPLIPSSFCSTLFDLAHYLTIAASFVVLGYDSFGGLKKKFA